MILNPFLAVKDILSPSKSQHEEEKKYEFQEQIIEQQSQTNTTITLTTLTGVCKKMKDYYEQILSQQHLKELLQNSQRNQKMQIEFDNILLDFSHEKLDEHMLWLLQELANEKQLFKQIESMFLGEKINRSENRAVLHMALRSDQTDQYFFQGDNVTMQVQDVLNQIKVFSQKIRSGALRGYTGKELLNYVVIGIGGSYLGIEFVYEAIKNSPLVKQFSEKRKLRFLANVDPVDFARAVDGLDPEETLFIINSKTFTTAETMLNAKSCRQWLLDHYSSQKKSYMEKGVIAAHLCASSTALKLTSEFGISPDKVFGFWDWVGGRYSVCSTIGILPLSLIFGFETMQQFLKGARSMDLHFRNNNQIKENIPMMLGMLGYYHNVIENYYARAILPYSQALCKFAPHIQQLDMESNGKSVLNTMPGVKIDFAAGVINFGEPGTNGQHSFYQLLHQGRTIPCEFIGFCKSQNPVFVSEEPVENHDELMSNFFSQPDALAYGKTIQQLTLEKVPEELLEHKFFPGNKPSLSFLFSELTPYTCGQLLAIYEHRTAVEGFLYGINSYTLLFIILSLNTGFDQWGVELGKALAKNVREVFKTFKQTKEIVFAENQFNSAIQKQMEKYLKSKI